MDIHSPVFARARPCAAFLAIRMFGSFALIGAQKTVCRCCGRSQKGWYDRRMRQVRDLSSAGFRIVLELEVRRLDCRRCGKVKRERLDFLADNAHFTKRFAFYVGRRCRHASIRDVAKELKLDWDTVKTLEKQYMCVQLKRAGMPGPRAVGIDEISIRKGHSYRIVVSDLVRKRPIWFSGTDRSEASMAQFYDWLGPKKSRKIELAVMDMWKPFRNVTKDKAPQAAVLFDKFHIMRHLGEALDKVRKAEYARLTKRQESALHQGPEVQSAIAARKPHPGRQTLAQDSACRQQAPQHCLRPQGGIRPALGLRA
jgi:transposase